MRSPVRGRCHSHPRHSRPQPGLERHRVQKGWLFPRLPASRRASSLVPGADSLTHRGSSSPPWPPGPPAAVFLHRAHRLVLFQQGPLQRGTSHPHPRGLLRAEPPPPCPPPTRPSANPQSPDAWYPWPRWCPGCVPGSGAYLCSSCWASRMDTMASCRACSRRASFPHRGHGLSLPAVSSHPSQDPGDRGWRENQRRVGVSRELACRVPGLCPARAPTPPLESLQVKLTTRGVEGQA